MEKAAHIQLEVYCVTMAQYRDNNMLLVQTLPRSLMGIAFASFTKIKVSKIKWWIDLNHMFIEQ